MTLKVANWKWLKNTSGYNLEYLRPSSLAKMMSNLVGLNNDSVKTYSFGRDAINVGNTADDIMETVKQHYDIVGQNITVKELKSLLTESIKEGYTDRMNKKSLADSVFVNTIAPNMLEMLNKIDLFETFVEFNLGGLVIDDKYHIKGTADLIVIDNDEVKIMDWKCYDGMSEQNKQYAHNQMLTYASIIRGMGFKVVSTTILNPLDNFTDEREVNDEILDDFITNQLTPACRERKEQKLVY
tara:strand:+ start:988 stop:1710 length:723 start_codon:yes stop_codon:yes gene_type:complete